MERMRSGRPRASSRETLAEAACELFLERGYVNTSILDIATRAGVSRSSFFNYFDSKSDLLWGGFDERLDTATEMLEAGRAVDEVLVGVASDFAPDSLALAIAHAQTMGIVDELDRERAERQSRLARAIARSAVRDGMSAFAADIRSSAVAGAFLAAVWAWALAGSARTGLVTVVDAALAAVPDAASVRRVRMPAAPGG